MTLGTFGSTLSDELNRLANGGTYRTMGNMVDDALAAKQWANRENINPYSTDTVGILNEIAGLGSNRQNWLDFNGVCNYIAGTTGLPAAAALRQVYNTTDLLTSQSAYYVDGYAGTNYIPTTASGYMYLPGVLGNRATAPDSAALDITGDIDIRAKVSLDDWIASGNNSLVAKWTSGQTAYMFSFLTTGQLSFEWSNSAATDFVVSSTEIPNFAAGTIKWVRVTLDVDNGASGKDVKFYTSDDGTTWTQLGATVTSAGTTNIRATTAILEIGNIFNAGFRPFKGKFYRAQIRNGIDGTVVFDANFETAMTSQTVASFTESSTNAATVTVNRTTYNFQLDTINNLGTAGSLLPTTLGSSTAADSNDPKFLDHTGTNYVYLPGSGANNMTIPDAANLQITGDIDLRIQVAPDDWTPSSNLILIGKNGASGNFAYALDLNSDGKIRIYHAVSSTSVLLVSSSVATGLADGSTKWIRATRVASTGVCQFFTSDNGTTWTQLGTDVTGTSGNIYAGTNFVTIGAYSYTGSTTQQLPGKIFRAQIFDGIDGTTVLDVDTSVITAGSATSFTAVTGQTVTINRSTSGRKTVAVTQPTWLFGTDDYMEVNNRYMASGTYLYLPGVAGNYASAPDAAALDITGDIDLRVKVAMDDWTPSATQILLAKRTAGSTQVSYGFYLNTSGTLAIYWTTDGTSVNAKTSTVALGAIDGATVWVRATLDVDNGASGNTVYFYYSTDGTTWTQLGDPVITAGTTSIYSGTAILEIGSQYVGTNSPSRGKFFRAQVLSGIDGTVAFDANFETSITSLTQASFTESSVNAATVTINRSGSAYRSAGITAAGYLYPGATNTFSASATDFLNFGAADNFTFFATLRQWSTPVNYANYFGKIDGVTPFVGYSLNNDAQALRIYATLDDGPNGMGNTVTYTNGQFLVATGVINRSTQIGTTYLNTTASTPNSISSIGSPSNIYPFRIGRPGSGSANIGDFEFLGGAVFRSALTAAQIRQIANYFANREVYL